MIALLLLMVAPTVPGPKPITTYDYQSFVFVPAKAKLLEFLLAEVAADTLPADLRGDRVRGRGGKVEYRQRVLDGVEIWHEVVEAEIDLGVADILKPDLVFKGPNGGHFLHAAVYQEIRGRLNKR